MCLRFPPFQGRSPARRWRLVLVVASVLGGCAATPPASHPRGAHNQVSGWPLATLAAAKGERTLLSANERPVAVVKTGALRAAQAAAQKVIAVMPMKASPLILISEGAQPNAFLFSNGSRPHVAANIGMLNLLGDDEAAWAALFGHELAHFTQRHRDTRADRESVSATAGGLLGAALVLVGIPLGSLIADSATTLVERGYSRDDERDADRLGVQAMVRAGYDPAGAVRLQEKLAGAGGDKPLPFLSTHPSNSERVESMRALASELGHPAPAPDAQEAPALN
jgi:Zn-dependent protease with chaperone function